MLTVVFSELYINFSYMRIGICTQPLSTNYGGILQNYALQTVLKRMGHSVWTFDYYKLSWFSWFNQAWRVFLLKLLGRNVKFGKTPSQIKVLEIPLRNFVQEQISLTSPRSNWFHNSVVRKYKLDAIIVGSDQTWRPFYNARIQDLFLDFVKSNQIRRVAYAASFGTDEWEFTSKQTKQCAELVKLFDSISVREKSGVRLCKDHLHVEAEHVLDPTLLLNAEDYSGLCKNIPRQQPFVFAYILDKNEYKIAQIKKYSQKMKLPYFILGADAEISENDSVEKWLSYFRDAEYVFTDSFHGTVFSIIFSKQFFIFGNTSRGNSRFSSLLTLLGLNKLLDNPDSMLIKKIDWSTIHSRLNNEREHSLTFLKKSLM